MKIIVKATGDGIAYAAKNDYEYEGTQYEADIKNGDKITIEDAGSIEESQFGPQHYFRIKTRNGTKKAPFNQTSLNILAEAFGDESEAWVGKQVNVLIKKTVIGGKKVMPAYFVTEDWYFDDFGDVVKDEAPSPRPEPAPIEKTNAQREVERVQRLKPEDSPF